MSEETLADAVLNDVTAVLKNSHIRGKQFGSNEYEYWKLFTATAMMVGYHTVVEEKSAAEADAWMAVVFEKFTEFSKVQGMQVGVTLIRRDEPPSQHTKRF